MKDFTDLLDEYRGKTVEVDKAFLLRVFGVLGTGSFVPSMFEEVRDIIRTLDSHLGEKHEDNNADRASGDGSDS